MPQNKLELFTGIPVQNQRILLLNNEQDADPVNTLDDDSRPLGFYSVRDWQFLKVGFVICATSDEQAELATISMRDTNR